MSQELVDCFISYASEDRLSVAGPLFDALTKKGLKVWYDKTELKLGDSLRKKIDFGLASCCYGIVILSHSFFEKEWPQSELDGLIARETSSGVKVILPVWHEINKQDIEKYSPIIAGRLSVSTGTGIDNVVAEIVNAIEPREKSPGVGGTLLPQISSGSSLYVSPSTSGVVTFDYSNNNGRYIIGTGDMVFETAWSRGSNSSIHVYNDPPSIHSVALAMGAICIADIQDASAYDTSSRTRTPNLGEVVIWQNKFGYYLATKIDKLQSRGHGAPIDEVSFSYVIAPSKSISFANTQ